MRKHIKLPDVDIHEQHACRSNTDKLDSMVDWLPYLTPSGSLVSLARMALERMEASSLRTLISTTKHRLAAVSTRYLRALQTR